MEERLEGGWGERRERCMELEGGRDGERERGNWGRETEGGGEALFCAATLNWETELPCRHDAVLANETHYSRYLQLTYHRVNQRTATQRAAEISFLFYATSAVLSS